MEWITGVSENHQETIDFYVKIKYICNYKQFKYIK